MTDLNLTGQHFIAGKWLSGDALFDSAPSTGPVRHFSEASQSHVDAAVNAAEEAFMSYGWSGQNARAAFLRTIADEIEAVGALVTEIGHQETGLPEARLEGERGRTTGQLRLFADHIEQGSYLEQSHDVALPDRAPSALWRFLGRLIFHWPFQPQAEIRLRPWPLAVRLF